MERPERMPLGTPTIRNGADTPHQNRRPIPNHTSTHSNPTPPPIPTLRKIGSASNLSASNIMPPSQVIALAREAMREALQSGTQAAESSAGGVGIKTGVTVDLSRKHITKLPEEVIDIVKDELERLALSHNQLTTLPARFTECTSLRYLNLRDNLLKKFPMALCELKTLEILDLGKNQLRVLPPELGKLTSLKVLSIPKNQIRELPMCLADMSSIQVVKCEGNPISFPPRDALRPQTGSPPNEGLRGDNEVTEVAITMNIKRYLKAYAANGRSEPDIPEEDRSETGDLPRPPLKRVTSGRFPIKVNGSDLSESRSPILGRPPPVPSRSHQRGFSQQNTAIRRPSVLPLTIGSVNERLRSNSESVLRAEKSESRQRRMGVVSRKTSELGTLDELEASNRLSHYRGLSHGSALTGSSVPSPGNGAVVDHTPTRPVYVRRLSVLPERRRESRVSDPMVEAAKGILYSVFQIHPLVQALMSLAHDGPAKRSSLEIVVYNTNMHVQELEQEIQKYESAESEGVSSSSRETESIQRACQTLIGAYNHVCAQLMDNIEALVEDGDARYIRTLMVMIYHSVMELRATLLSVSGKKQTKPRQISIGVPDGGHTIKPHQREGSGQRTTSRPPPVTRSRNGTVVHNPNLRVATDVLVNQTDPGLSSMPDSATPRSGESFAMSNNYGPHHHHQSEYSEEDAQFDRIFLSLQKSAAVVMQTLPNFQIQLTGGMRNAMQQRAPKQLINDWRILQALCANAIQQTEILKSRLSNIKLKEPHTRSHVSFWNVCSSFVASWTEVAQKIKSSINTLPLPPDTRARLRPIQQSMKETSNAIVQSTWHHLFRPSGSMGGSSSGIVSPFGSQTVNSLHIPITPQSAALGPAMQATVPTTPQSASFAAAFHGTVFDRADALMANPGISMSRGRTMTRGHSGFNSMSSMSSMSSDGKTSSASSFSPSGPEGAASFRRNGSKGQ